MYPSYPASTTQRERLVGMRILVSIDSWPIDSEYPLGHYIQTLGGTGTKEAETMDTASIAITCG